MPERSKSIFQLQQKSYCDAIKYIYVGEEEAQKSSTGKYGILRCAQSEGEVSAVADQKFCKFNCQNDGDEKQTHADKRFCGGADFGRATTKQPKIFKNEG